MNHPYYPDVTPCEGSLHSFDYERDACGVGFVAQVQGIRSHSVLRAALTSCCNVVHRGAIDADLKTGDGAGVMTQIPIKLFAKVLADLDTSVNNPEDLGVGVFFLPRARPDFARAQQIIEEEIERMNLRLLGWREVPANKRELGDKARRTMPSLFQVLVGRPDTLPIEDYERTLFLCRRAITLRIKRTDPRIYCASFSHRTMVYKALVVATALEKFYYDFQDPDFETAIALYHQRYSTNTFPTWQLGHPFQVIAHNGEINTLRGNRNWMSSRTADFEHEVWGENKVLLDRLIDQKGSDSHSLDAALELLMLSGRSLPHALSILVPPAYGIDPETTQEQRDFYEYYSCYSEPWDGPAAIVASDGLVVTASLDRNGLRPSRFKLTQDGIFTLGSEVGVVEIDDETVIRKGRLGPGEMICVDTVQGRVIYNDELKASLAQLHPYGQWLKENRVSIAPKAPNPPKEIDDILALSQRQVTFGYNKEELDIVLSAFVANGEEAIHSMGDDIPLAVLSRQPRLLYTYFKQLFAQVTNPPIDPIRERAVMSLEVNLGRQRNLLQETPEHAKVIHLKSPILFENELQEITSQPDFPSRVLDITWPLSEGVEGLEKAITRLEEETSKAVEDGIQILVLSDRATSQVRVPIPALLATGSVHHHLNRIRQRMKLSIVVETAEARDTHQVACLFGYGASAVCPWLAFETIQEMLQNDQSAKAPKFKDVDYTKALQNYRKGLEKGLLKIMSKMGISVLSSYIGAQIFEAIGISKTVIKRSFTRTASQLEGLGYEEIAMESIARHQAGYAGAIPESGPIQLGDPGYIRWRRDAELHAITPPVLKNFHAFVKKNQSESYKEYVEAINHNQPIVLHDLLEFVPSPHGPIPIEEVEPIEDIRVRFTTAAMSLGALSPEAHEDLAIAMNRIGGKSNSGEGGEDPKRFKPYENGDWAGSKIKQIASGRFGVTAEYLANAYELEIKMAQGAKPGEGGQLPAFKVNKLIARLRGTEPGVQLISPPPHHDIYSIEDLAQLIHDLKEVNPRARVCVKLVAVNGVGTIAAGVAKANADIILISGFEGGTGASPVSSIKNCGMPWQLGIAEAQQVLMLNGLRENVTLRTDGGLRSGRDIVTAAILGAEEFNFGTIALIALGCVYVRQCHLNNCPTGVATQDPKYRAKYKGKPEMVVDFFNAVASEVREIMASLGVRKLDDLIGRPDFLRQKSIEGHPKANSLNLSPILKDVAKEQGEDMPRRCLINRNDGVQSHPLDDRILQAAHISITDKRPVNLSYKVQNTNRNVGTKVAGAVAFHHGNHGLPDNTITVNLEGSAGQSFGTFICGGIRLILTGEANDYVGKGMCGGEIVIKPSPKVTYPTWENSILGNTVMYGASGGKLFAAGQAGERFCVRNSGGTAVVEGIGDHGCEYMTRGTVVVLGKFGKNFGAGMSGGVAYLYDPEAKFESFHNPEMIQSESLADPHDIETLKNLILEHGQKTGSRRAADMLADWEAYQSKFIKVSPKVKPVFVPGDEEEEASAVSVA